MAAIGNGLGPTPAQGMWNGELPSESPPLSVPTATGPVNSQVPRSNYPFPQNPAAPAAGLSGLGANTARTCACQPSPQSYHHTEPHHIIQPSNLGPTPTQPSRVAFQSAARPNAEICNHTHPAPQSQNCNHGVFAPWPRCPQCEAIKGQTSIPQPSSKPPQPSELIFLNGKWFNISSAEGNLPPPPMPVQSEVKPKQQEYYPTVSVQPNLPQTQPTTGPSGGPMPMRAPQVPGTFGVPPTAPKMPGTAGYAPPVIQPRGRPPLVPGAGSIPFPPGWKGPRAPGGGPPNIINVKPKKSRPKSSGTTDSSSSSDSSTDTSDSENSDPEISSIQSEEAARYNPFDYSSDDSDSGDDSSSSTSYILSSTGNPTKSPSTWHSPSKNLLPKPGNNLPQNLRGKSPASEEWERQKRELGAKNTALDRFMSMVGMEELKMGLLKMKSTIETAHRRKGRLRWQDLNLVLTGNPGTGKRTLGGLYHDFLSECGVWSDAKNGNVPYKIMSGIEVDIGTLRFNLSDIAFLFIHSIDTLDDDDRPKLLNLLDQHPGKLVVVLSGSPGGMARFLGGSLNGRWQFGRKFQLNDFEDGELRLILLRLFYYNSLKMVGGDESLAPLVAAKRVGKGRNSKTFGNAYDMISEFEKILERHAARLGEERQMIRAKEAENLKSKEELSRVINEYHDKSVDRSALLANALLILLFVLFFGKDFNFTKITKAAGNEAIEEKPVEVTKEKDKVESSTASRKKKKGHKKAPPEPKHIEDNKNQLDEISWLTTEDILGKQPSSIYSRSDAWKELEKMAGITKVKRAIQNLAHISMENYHREINGKEPLQISLNRVFLGPPGTGKTTVAKLYGQMLADIGLLSSNEVVIKTPGDFIGQYLGDSEGNTNAILESAKGKVLIIDDAYMFYHDTGSGAHHDTDEYRMACVDTLVSNIHNTPGEDRCVILIGYIDLMEAMFEKVNPGLRRRFPLEDAFYFEDYDDEQLNEILRLKMANEEIKAEKPAMDVAAEVLRRIRDRPNFGNGGDVQNLLDQAKTRFRERNSNKRIRGLQDAGGAGGVGFIQLGAAEYEVADELDQAIILEREDFDPEWDRGVWASQKCASLFQGLVGFEPIIHQMQDYQRIATNMRSMGKDPRNSIPFTFVFKGPPGTGKTHTARIMGQIFYDMGFLSTSEVIECSATHLIGEFLGQTGPKVVSLLDRALGKVLFIDEAYRLGTGSQSSSGKSYEQEAIGELVDRMTKPRYLRKLIIVLAGYEDSMDEFMEANPGLRGRFPTDLTFHPMSPRHCEEHLINLIRTEGIFIQDQVEASYRTRDTVLRLLEELSMTPGWSNARDVRTLATMITADVYRRDFSKSGNGFGAHSLSGGMLGISTNDVIACLKKLLKQRDVERGRRGFTDV